jgi:hypothetical protein
MAARKQRRCKNTLHSLICFSAAVPEMERDTWIRDQPLWFSETVFTSSPEHDAPNSDLPCVD